MRVSSATLWTRYYSHTTVKYHTPVPGDAGRSDTTPQDRQHLSWLPCGVAAPPQGDTQRRLAPAAPPGAAGDQQWPRAQLKVSGTAATSPQDRKPRRYVTLRKWFAWPENSSVRAGRKAPRQRFAQCSSPRSTFRRARSLRKKHGLRKRTQTQESRRACWHR